MVGSGDGPPANVNAGIASDGVDAVPVEEVAERAGLSVPFRLLQGRSPDLAAVHSIRSPIEASVQPAETVSSGPYDDGLDALLAAQMEQPLSDEETTPAAACDHAVAGEVSTARVASEPPAAVSAEEVWRRFTPTVIDPVKCLARTFNGGAGGQCKRKPQAGDDICGNCKKLAHGRVDGPIPDGKLEAFLRSARRM